MFAIAHTAHSYAYFINPFMIQDDIYSLYLKMSALTPTEKPWHLASLEFNRRRIEEVYGPMPQLDRISDQRIRSLERDIRRNWHRH
ncbi:unnamed protein product [Sphagnum balticum]